jgi:molecular chaperone DnaJ
MPSTTSSQNYYERLGIARDATAEQIRKAYRSLARKHHPDVNTDPASEERFKDIKEAYEILSDPEKRQYYDRFGQAPGASGPGFGPDGPGDFGQDIFDMFFGGGSRSARRNAAEDGSDLRYDLTLTLDEAASGVEKVLDIERERSCQSCSGTGSRDAKNLTPCVACAGTGQVRHAQQTIFGSFVATGTCSRCRGEGVVVTDPCPQCRGSGRERAHSEVKVKVPAGVDTGNRIRIQREGDGGHRGGQPGDLYIFIQIQPHERFERRHSDLLCEVDVPFWDAALGASIEVPTLDGKCTLEIPPGTQAGQSFAIRGQGMPELNRRGKGDLHVYVRIPVPATINDRQRRALDELALAFGAADSLSQENRGIRGIFERAREVLEGRPREHTRAGDTGEA